MPFNPVYGSMNPIVSNHRTSPTRKSNLPVIDIYKSKWNGQETYSGHWRWRRHWWRSPRGKRCGQRVGLENPQHRHQQGLTQEQKLHSCRRRRRCQSDGRNVAAILAGGWEQMGERGLSSFSKFLDFRVVSSLYSTTTSHRARGFVLGRRIRAAVQGGGAPPWGATTGKWKGELSEMYGIPTSKHPNPIALAVKQLVLCKHLSHITWKMEKLVTELAFRVHTSHN